MKQFKRTSYKGPARNVVVCIDGTQQYEEQTDNLGRLTPTNVAKIKQALVQDEKKQIVEYFRGLGNEKDHWILRQLLGGALGAGAYPLLLDAQCWLCTNYRPGDRLSIFGFSRGAALARMLANSVRKTGIPAEIVFKRVPVGGRKSGHSTIKAYRRKPIKNVPVTFLGCWDTVASFGIPLDVMGIPFQSINMFKDFRVSANVKRAVHCLALDEQRHPFVHTPMKKEERIEEVWFAGWHSDIGGGNFDDGLSDITLEFMVNRAEAYGLLFKPSWAEEVACQPDPTGVMHPESLGGFETRRAPATANVHISVRERMSAQKDYQPAALPDMKSVKWFGHLPDFHRAAKSV